MEVVIMSSDLAAAEVPIIDVDAHVTEPATLWTERVSSKWGDLVPHVVTEPDGGERWMVGNKRLESVGKWAAAG